MGRNRDAWDDPLLRDTVPPGEIKKYFGEQLDKMTPEMYRATVRVFWLAQLYTAPAGDFCNSDGTTQGYAPLREKLLARMTGLDGCRTADISLPSWKRSVTRAGRSFGHGWRSG